MSEPYVTYTDLIHILEDFQNYQEVTRYSYSTVDDAIEFLTAAVSARRDDILSKQAEYASEEHQRYHHEPHGGAS